MADLTPEENEFITSENAESDIPYAEVAEITVFDEAQLRRIRALAEAQDLITTGTGEAKGFLGAMGVQSGERRNLGKVDDLPSSLTYLADYIIGEPESPYGHGVLILGAPAGFYPVVTPPKDGSPLIVELKREEEG